MKCEAALRASLQEPPPYRQRALPELAAVLELTCRQAELLCHSERPWSSATFSGVRHTISLRFVGGEAITYAEAFIEALPEHEFALADKLVADAQIVAVDRIVQSEPETTVTIQLLVLDDYC